MLCFKISRIRFCSVMFPLNIWSCWSWILFPYSEQCNHTNVHLSFLFHTCRVQLVCFLGSFNSVDSFCFYKKIYFFIHQKLICCWATNSFEKKLVTIIDLFPFGLYLVFQILECCNSNFRFNNVDISCFVHHLYFFKRVI